MTQLKGQAARSRTPDTGKANSSKRRSSGLTTTRRSFLKKAGIAGAVQIPIHYRDALFHAGLVEIDDVVIVRSEHGDFTVIEVHHRPSVLHDRSGVRCNEVLAITQRQHQRRAGPRGH